MLETIGTGYACEAETSTMLHISPELVNIEEVLPQPFTSLNRNAELSAAGVHSPVDWYATYPRMYVGEARPATAAKGQALAEQQVAALVRLLRAARQDQGTAELRAGSQDEAVSPRSPWEHTRGGTVG